MTQHQQWIPVTAEGAEQLPGFRCDGCGQVKWQAEKPTAPCDICESPAPVIGAPSTPYNNQGSLPPVELLADMDRPAAGGTWSSEMEKPDPKPRRSRNPGLTKEGT